MQAKQSGPPLGQQTGVTPPGPHNLMRARPGGRRGAPPGRVGCFPGTGVGGAWLFAMPRYRDALAARRIGQCAEPGKPTGDRRLSHGVLSSRKWGELHDWYVE